MNQSEKPFADLGSHLRTVRELSRRSLDEVSGAVEIEPQALEQIEAGLERPEEDVMLLLISYFNVQDQEALHLWELADYESDLHDHMQFDQAPTSVVGKPMVLLLAVDVRTMYTDGLDVTVNPAGVTLQFTQSQSQPRQNSGSNQPAAVSRVGMSHQQAELVIKTLQTALLHAKYNNGPKLLPPPQA